MEESYQAASNNGDENVNQVPDMKTSSSERDILFNEELFHFDTAIENELEKVNIQRQDQEKVVNDSMTELLNSVHSQHTEMKKKITLFFEDKKRTLKKALEDAKLLKQLDKNSSCDLIKKHLKKLTEDFMYSTRNLMERTVMFDEKFNYENKCIGKLVMPLFETPIRNQTIKLDKEGRKIVSTKRGFYVLHDDNEIIKLSSRKCIITSDRKILDICSTYDHNFSYITYDKRQFCCKILDLDTHNWQTITLPECDVDPLSVMFGVYRTGILIGSKKRHKLFFYDIETLVLKIFANEDLFLSHKSFSNGLCTANAYAAKFYDIIKDMSYQMDIQRLDTENYSLYDCLIRKINEGKNIFCNSLEVMIIDFQLRTVTCINQSKLFEDWTLEDCRINDEEFILCLSNLSHSNQYSIQYYPRFMEH